MFPQFPGRNFRSRDVSCSCVSAGGCFHLGNHGAALRADWEVVKVDVMYAANLAKFTQAPGLSELLVSRLLRSRLSSKSAELPTFGY